MKIIRRTAYFVLFASLTFGLCELRVQAQTTAPQIARINPVSLTENQSEDTDDKKRSLAAEQKKTVELNNITVLHRVGVQTGETLPLTLNEAIRLALENNNSIEIARTDVRLQEAALRAQLGFFDPVLTVTPNFTRNSITGSTAANDFRVNTDVTQLVRPGGGSYRVFFNNTRTENSFSQAQLSSGSTTGGAGGALYSSNLGIAYTQPLMRNFKIDNTRRQIKIQRKRLAQSDADFRRQTIEVIAQVQRAYWDLVFALRDQQNRIANLNLSRENLRLVEARISAGSAAPLERAEVSTELANREAETLLATQQVSVAENTLKTLLLKNADSSEWTRSLVPTDRPVFSDEPVGLDDAVKDAIANRPELNRLRLQNEINRIDIDYFRNQTKPQIDITNSFSLGGLARGGAQNTEALTIPIISGNPNTNANAFLLQQINAIRRSLNPVLPDITSPTVTIPPSPAFLSGGFNRSLANLFRSDAPSYSFGVTISLPLRNRTAEANLTGARIQQEQISAQLRSQEQSVIAEVRNAVQAVETTRLRVLVARRARENAEIQLEGERKLYEVGRSTTFLLFQRENALANARNAEIRAETDYNKALADLQRATSTTFRANNIEVESPTDDK